MYTSGSRFSGFKIDINQNLFSICVCTFLNSCKTFASFSSLEYFSFEIKETSKKRKQFKKSAFLYVLKKLGLESESL